MQLRSPSDQTQRAIQDLWAQLVGSKALIASDVLKLSSESLSLQLRGTAKTSKERENTPRPTPSRPAPGSVTTPTAKQNSRSGTRLSHRHSSNPTSAQKAAGKARGPSAGRRDSLLISSEQPAAEIADSLGPADSFAKCLREICCQAACDEENNGASGLGSCNLEISFDIMEPVNESDDDAIAPAEAFSDQLLPWRRQIFSESETQETPKDWVNLLKVMAQEATALFRKHKTLKDKEVCSWIHPSPQTRVGGGPADEKYRKQHNYSSAPIWLVLVPSNFQLFPGMHEMLLQEVASSAVP